LNLGDLKELPRGKRKQLADKIEEKVTGSTSIFQPPDKEVEELAEKYAAEIIKKGVFPAPGKKHKLKSSPQQTEELVDPSTIDMDDSRELGGGWLCKQAFEKIGLPETLADMGFDGYQTAMAMILIAAKMLHPSSELETERWLQTHTELPRLFEIDEQDITRYRLYQTAEKLYQHREELESLLYDLCSGLFSNDNHIVIYDLTNMYFEGMMKSSNRAMFGRSKEKRSDCGLIGLSLAIDSLGFFRHSQFYPVNISEPSTLADIISKLHGKLQLKNEKPVITMDAGIASDENLAMLKARGYDYVSVSRSKPKGYIRQSRKVLSVQDNTGSTIEIEKVSLPGQDDTFLRVKSENKGKKEASIDEKLTQRFEQRLTYVRQGLDKPRRLKKITPVHKHIGRLKDQFSSVAKYYTINYVEDRENNLVKDITWTRNTEKQKPNGEYFLRYSKKHFTEKDIWYVYNLAREVEASFRCLKNDLDIRPIFHQKDKYIEPLIWLGLLAYQVVNYIRLRLRDKNINYSWSKISTIMQAQQSATVSMNAKEGRKIYARVCSRPNKQTRQIYEALGWKTRPWVRKINVMTQK